MTRETKVGLVVATSFVCLVGGVFATKYLHKETKPDGSAPVAQTPGPEKPPSGGEEPQQVPPSPPGNPGDIMNPLYKPPESKGSPPSFDLPLGPAIDPTPRKPAAPPPDLDPPLGPPGKSLVKPATPGVPSPNDPDKDDVFNPNPVPSKSNQPKMRPPADDGNLPLMPVPSGPAKPAKPSVPELDLAPPPAKDTKKDPPKMLPPGGDLDAPPRGGVTRVGNPPDPIPGLDLPTGDKKDEKPAPKKDEKKDEKKLPPPGDLPGLELVPPTGNNPPNLPAPADTGKPPIVPPMPNKPGDRKMDPPMLNNPKPTVPDLPPSIGPKDTKNPPNSDVPAPLPKQPAKPAIDPGSSMLPMDKKSDAAASISPKGVAPAPDNTTPPPESRVESYEEEWYYCKQGDSLESISQKFFFTPKYEQALRQYNLDRNYQASFRQERPALQFGQVVKVPPARVLEMKYPATLPGFRPASSPKPDAAGGPSTIPPTATPDGELIGQAREYVVKREGMTLKDIAREELRDERQWTRIFMLNREWNPSAPIPKDTRISLPRSQ